MNQEIIFELRFFITSILWGVFLLVIYDVFRVLRRIITHNGFFIAVEDILYWVVSSILIFRMMYRQNNGIIRGFAILAILLGMIMYHGSVSDLIVNTIATFINSIIHIIKKVLTFIIRIITKPFRIIGRRLKKIIVYFYKKIKKLLSLLLKSLKKNRKEGKINTIDKKEKKKSKNSKHHDKTI